MRDGDEGDTLAAYFDGRGIVGGDFGSGTHYVGDNGVYDASLCLVAISEWFSLVNVKSSQNFFTPMVVSVSVAGESDVLVVLL